VSFSSLPSLSAFSAYLTKSCASLSPCCRCMSYLRLVLSSFTNSTAFAFACSRQPQRQPFLEFIHRDARCLLAFDLVLACNHRRILVSRWACICVVARRSAPLASSCHGCPPNILILRRIRIAVDIHIVLSDVVYLKDDVIEYIESNYMSVENDT
jgi:hypothetical protein